MASAVSTARSVYPTCSPIQSSKNYNQQFLQKPFSSNWNTTLSLCHKQLKYISSSRTERKRLCISAALTPAFNSENEGQSKISKAVKLLLGSASPPLSDIVWSAVGAFFAMSGFAYADHLLASKGLSMTMGSFAALCALLFAIPKSPTSQKWNVIVAQIGCAFVSVLVLSVCGTGWFSRSLGVALCISFMLFSSSVNPPAAGLPLIFIDAPKFQHLNWWYVLFPGLLGCFYLFFLQEVVAFLKEKFKF